MMWRKLPQKETGPARDVTASAVELIELQDEVSVEDGGTSSLEMREIRLLPRDEM